MSAVLDGQTLRKEESAKKAYRVSITFLSTFESSEDCFPFVCLCKFLFGSLKFFNVFDKTTREKTVFRACYGNGPGNRFLAGYVVSHAFAFESLVPFIAGCVFSRAFSPGICFPALPICCEWFIAQFAVVVTVESRFFKLPGETKTGPKNRIVREIGDKITVID